MHKLIMNFFTLDVVLSVNVFYCLKTCKRLKMTLYKRSFEGRLRYKTIKNSNRKHSMILREI